MSKASIAFLGLGIMGSGMARRLLTNGFPVTAFNRNAEKTKPFAAEGAGVAGSPRDAAEKADVIISMVADDEASRAMWLGERGAFAGVKPGTVCIECSTVTVDVIRVYAAIAKEKKCDFLDCPVTGSKMHVAALAEALVMIERSGLDRAKSLEVLTNGAPGSPLVKMVSARMTAPDYT